MPALLTVFVITGMANAVNIIDGFNGLASMCVLMMMLAPSYIAFQVGDAFLRPHLDLHRRRRGARVLHLEFPGRADLPRGRRGLPARFPAGEPSILLLRRNAAMRPSRRSFRCCCAPTHLESIFTIYRRKVVRGVATAHPDGIHLHALVHRRLIRWTPSDNLEGRRLTRRNSMTSPYCGRCA